MRLNKCPLNKFGHLSMIIKIKELEKLVGLSESTIRREIDDGNFPHSVSISKRLVGWRLKDIEAWEAKLS